MRHYQILPTAFQMSQIVPLAIFGLIRQITIHPIGGAQREIKLYSQMVSWALKITREGSKWKWYNIKRIIVHTDTAEQS